MGNISDTVVGRIKTNFIFKNIFPKIVFFLRYVEKYGTDRQVTDENIRRSRKDAICMPDN
jgi:hypothetical protein